MLVDDEHVEPVRDRRGQALRGRGVEHPQAAGHLHRGHHCVERYLELAQQHLRAGEDLTLAVVELDEDCVRPRVDQDGVLAALIDDDVRRAGRRSDAPRASCTPASSSSCRSTAAASSPTAPTKTVAAPQRAAATAWFAPLPPGRPVRPAACEHRLARARDVAHPQHHVEVGAARATTSGCGCSTGCGRRRCGANRGQHRRTGVSVGARPGIPSSR